MSLLVSPIYAAELAPSPWTNETTDEAKTLAKFKFGLKNLFFGWTEVFDEPYETYKKENDNNMFEAVGIGAVYALVDTAFGALQVITSPLPGVDIPLPEGGVDF